MQDSYVEFETDEDDDLSPGFEPVGFFKSSTVITSM